jgi:hypothetical protein
MTFFDIAKPLAERGIPQIRLRPRTKIAFETDWPVRATTNLSILKQWSDEMPDANAASVARGEIGGFWFFEIDKPNFHKEIEQQTGQCFPDTFIVRSSPGRGHFFFRQTASSIAMGNCQGKDADGKEIWSARVDSRYVVSAGSEHPTSGRRYEIVRDSPIVEAPEWLIQWCINQKSEPKKILMGSRNNTLTSLLGKARQTSKLNTEELITLGLQLNKELCDPPLSEQEVQTIARSVGKYEIAPMPPVIMGGQVIGQSAPVQPAEPLIIKPIPYPVWPEWVMKGTSIYDGFIKPICDENSRYPQFMFMPAMVLILNYLGLKVSIEENPQLIPSFYMMSIGRKGRVIKSSSVQDAIEYLRIAGIVEFANSQTRNAGGKSLIWTAGSPEGLGLEMARTACKNAVLFYDELSTLTSKAAIENSTLKQSLLTMYESGQFANIIKNRKETFVFEPKSYCASLIACTTDKNFSQHWSRMSGDSSGLDERFFFLYQPENLINLTPQKYVNTVEGTIETRRRIDKAVQQRTYHLVDDTFLHEYINRLGNRTEQRLEKMALFFAVDMGKDEIDESCIERALAISKYELAVKKYLSVFESTTKEGALQQEIIQLLQRHNGVVTSRQLDRALHPERHGTYLWQRVYSGLLQAGWIAESGAGTKNNPKQVVLLRVPEDDDENN